jgi:hypothetical protein
LRKFFKNYSSPSFFNVFLSTFFKNCIFFLAQQTEEQPQAQEQEAAPEELATNGEDRSLKITPDQVGTSYILREREGWAGLGWAGLGWAGLAWAGLGRLSGFPKP